MFAPIITNRNYIIPYNNFILSCVDDKIKRKSKKSKEIHYAN